MSDAIVNQAAQQLAQQMQDQGAASAQSQVPTEEVSQADEAAFQDAMNGVDSAEGAADAQQVSEAAESDACSKDHKCLGDAILDGLEQIKGSHDAHMERIQTQLQSTGGENLTIQDAMRLQFEVMQMGIEQDLTVKMADKGSQGLQTMFRNQ